MNKDRRKRVGEAIAKLNEAAELIDEIMNEEQEAYDAMPEGFQNGDRGQQSQEAIDQLSSGKDSAEQAISELEAIA